MPFARPFAVANLLNWRQEFALKKVVAGLHLRRDTVCVSNNRTPRKKARRLGFMSKRSPLVFALIALLVVFMSSLGAQESKESKKDSSKQQERAAEASEVLNEIMAATDTSIPDKLMERAHGVAVIPHVVKGALGIGGQGGKGLMSQRGEDGRWSPPAYIEFGGGSIGFQIGVSATDVVLVFTDENGLRGILKSKLKLGADASVAAGPVGRKGEVGTDALLKSSIFSYSRSKGLFAGVSLDGSVISVDDSANAKVYGKNVRAEDILFGKATTNDPEARAFMSALQKYSPPHVHASAKK